MTTLENLETEITNIYQFLTSDIPDDLSVLPEIGSSLANFISRTGQMLADAKYYQNCAIKNAIRDNEQGKMNTSIYNQFIKTSCTREAYIVDLCERCNASATHSLDWVRTLISKGKEEMRLSNMQTK